MAFVVRFADCNRQCTPKAPLIWNGARYQAYGRAKLGTDCNSMLEDHKVANPTSKRGNEVHEGITAADGQPQVRLYVLFIDGIYSNPAQVSNGHGDVLGTWRDCRGYCSRQLDQWKRRRPKIEMPRRGRCTRNHAADGFAGSLGALTLSIQCHHPAASATIEDGNSDADVCITHAWGKHWRS